MGNQKKESSGKQKIITVLAVIPIIIWCILMFLSVTGHLEEGYLGFFGNFFIVIIGLILIAFIIYTFLTGKYGNRKDSMPGKRNLVSAAGAVIAGIIILYMAAPYFMDLPYIKNPEVLKLHSLKFEIRKETNEEGDTDTYYLMYGKDDMETDYEFKVNNRIRNEGEQIIKEKGKASVDINYLPNTLTILNREFK